MVVVMMASPPFSLLLWLTGSGLKRHCSALIEFEETIFQKIFHGLLGLKLYHGGDPRVDYSKLGLLLFCYYFCSDTLSRPPPKPTPP